MKIQRRSQLGFGILEMTVAIAVGLIATVSGVRWYIEYTDQTVFDVAAQQQKQVAESVTAYLRDNRKKVKEKLNPNGAVSSGAITLFELKKEGYLPKHLLDKPDCANASDCSLTTPYQQQFAINTRLTGTGDGQRVEAILYTKPSSSMTLREVTAIARRLGASGGAIDSTKNKIIGALGGWEVPANKFGAGGAANTYGVASAIFFEDGMEVGDYLHRNEVPGRPELNQMKTDLSLGGNDITAAKNVTATGLVSAKDVTASETVKTKDLVVSDKASVRNNITSEAGWLIAKNSSAGLQADRFRSVSSVGGQGEASWVNSGDKLVFNVNKGVKVNGRLETTEYLSLGGTATEGAACEKNGLVAKDSSGALLSCQSGSWKGSSSEGFTNQDNETLLVGVTYTNTTGKAMMLTARAYHASDTPWNIGIVVNEVTVASFGRGSGAGGGWHASGSAMIPPGATYKITRSYNPEYHTTIWY